MFISERIKIFLPAALLFVLCLLVYTPVLQHQFLGDDFFFLRFHEVSRIFREPGLIFARTHHFEPLYNLTNGILFSLFKEAGPLYGINIFLFFINCYLLFVVIFLFTRQYFVALGTSLLFCMHPMSAEVMMHIAFNNILFSVIFMELSLIALYKHIEQSKNHVFYGLSLASFFVALLFQEVSWFFIFYAAAFLYYRTADVKKTLRLCLPFILLTGVCVITWLWLAGSKTSMLERAHSFHLTFWVFVANFFILIKWYISNLFLPTDIVFMFNMLPVKSFIWLWNMACVSFTASFCWLIWRNPKPNTEGLGLAVFMSGLLFVIPGSICRPQMGFVVEPYWFYFSSIGFFLIVASAIQRMQGFCNKYLFVTFITAITIFLLAMTFRHIPVGRNDISYCLNWLNKSPNNTIALETLEGLFSFEKDMEIQEPLISQMSFLADWHLKINANARAIRVIKLLVRSEKRAPEKRILLCKLAVAYEKNGDVALADEIMRTLVREGTSQQDLFQLCYIFFDNGISGKTRTMLERCQAMDPQYLEPYLLLGVMLANEARYAESLAWLEKGLALAPADARFSGMIRDIQRKLGRDVPVK